MKKMKTEPRSARYSQSASLYLVKVGEPRFTLKSNRRGDLFQIAAPDTLSNAAKQEMPHGTRSESVFRRQSHGDRCGALSAV